MSDPTDVARNAGIADDCATTRRTASASAANRSSDSTTAPAASLNAAQLTEYAGRYSSDEADTTFVIHVEGGSLGLKREREASPIVLRTAAPDRFAGRGMVIRFLRENGRVTALAVDAGRVVDIRFTRQSDGS